MNYILFLVLWTISLIHYAVNYAVSGNDFCDPKFCWLTGCYVSHKCSLSWKNGFCQEVCSNNPEPLIPGKCRKQLREFVECLKPDIPLMENTEYESAVTQCFLESDCASPDCVEDTVMKMLPAVSGTCFGVANFGIPQMKYIGALGWSLAANTQKSRILSCRSELEEAACHCVKHEEMSRKMMKHVEEKCGVLFDSNHLFGGLTEELCDEEGFFKKLISGFFG